MIKILIVFLICTPCFGKLTIPLPATTKGDLIIHNGSDVDRFAVCPNGQTIQADSTQTLGWKCASGSTSVTQVEVDFGASPLTEKLVTVTDAGITGTSKIMATLARATSTGKTFVDETDMDEIMISCSPNTGSMDCLVRSQKGQFMGTLKINYQVGA